jgi:hypothetical protein
MIYFTGGSTKVRDYLNLCKGKPPDSEVKSQDYGRFLRAYRKKRSPKVAFFIFRFYKEPHLISRFL